jgi:16S rRNA (guanine527-N7)-methyltransferase
MSTALQPLGKAWQPLLDTAITELAAAGLDLQSVWPSPDARSGCLRRLRRLLDLVVVWNARVDLTAARDARQLVDLYLADALVLATRAAAPGRPPEQAWLDVGSGAGAPGLVLQVLQPQLALTLVEPRAKRVSFLRTAAGSLDLSRLPPILGCRSDAVPPNCSDVAVSRATFSPEVWLPEGARLARGFVWVLLARGSAPKLAGFRVCDQIEYAWPLTGVARHALCFTRMG